MPTDQDQAVTTGLVAPEAPAQNSTIADDTKAGDATEAAPVASADVPLVQVAGLGPDVTAKVEEVNQPAAAVSQDFTKDDQLHAESDNLQRDFLARVAAAKEAGKPKEYTTPPIPERIAEQTRLEMEAGRRRVAEFAALEASRPKRPGTQDTVAVFRPADFVPDQKKGQGVIASNSARTL